MMLYDVAIVGAGVCGLTAAIELAGKNLKVLVIEAAPASGGRARSRQTQNGLIVDEGAHWFHGADDNGFYNWAKARYDLGPLILDKIENRIVRWRNGDAAAFDAVLERMDIAFTKKQSLPENPSLYDVALQADAVGLADFMASGWMATDDARDIAARDFFDDPLGPGGWQMEKGVCHLIDAMEKDARRRGVIFVHGAPVRMVQENENSIDIHIQDGRIFTCAKCLVTVSVSVLGTRGIQFAPQVQSMIEYKINPLRMAHLAKIVVPLRCEFFQEKNIANDTAFYLVDDDMFIHARTAGANSITVFQGGRKGCALECMTSQDAEVFIQGVFRRIPEFSSHEIYRDGLIFQTKWHDNTLTLGSYSYCRPEGRRPDPFHAGNIYFAGEAFVARAEHSAGQMAGAFHSARMAADLLRLKSE